MSQPVDQGARPRRLLVEVRGRTYDEALLRRRARRWLALGADALGYALLSRRRVGAPATADRFLFIHPGRLGDVVLALYVMRAARQARPRAHLALAVHPSLTELVRCCPDVDEVLPYRAPWLRKLPEPARALREYVSFLHRIRQRRYDAVADLRGDLFGALLLLAPSGARELAGRTHRGGGFVLTRPVGEREGAHELEAMAAVLAALGFDAPVARPRIHINATDRDWARTALGRSEADQGPPLIVLHPGATWLNKQWDSADFATVARGLQDEIGAQVALIGDAGARGLTATVARDIPGAVDLAGATGLLQLAAVLESADLVVSTDSGPMHLAAALGRPVVGIFCPSPAQSWHPWGERTATVEPDLPCAPCWSRRCRRDAAGHRECARVITVEAVIAAAREVLRGPGRTRYLCGPQSWRRVSEDAPTAGVE